MTFPSWVPLHIMAHSFVELCKPFHHNKAVRRGGTQVIQSKVQRLNGDICVTSETVPSSVTIEGDKHTGILHVLLFSSVAQSCPTLCYPMNRSNQASLSITNSQSSLRFTSIESVMPSSHHILCCPLLLLPSIILSIRVFSNESVHYIRWPKYWSFSVSINPSNDYSGLMSFKID